MTSGRHLVVLAGADAEAVDSMAATLRDDGTVRTAYSPAGLRETLDDEVDVVLVDRDLRDGPLEPILADLQAPDAGWQVAVLDADADRDRSGDQDWDRGSSRCGQEATVDAVVGWDGDAVRETVSRLAARARYRKRLDEYYALAEERAALADESEDEEVALKRDRLDRQLERLRRDLADEYRRIDDASAFDAVLSPRERKLDGDRRNAPDEPAGSGESGGTEPDVCDE